MYAYNYFIIVLGILNEQCPESDFTVNGWKTVTTMIFTKEHGAKLWKWMKKKYFDKGHQDIAMKWKDF